MESVCQPSFDHHRQIRILSLKPGVGKAQLSCDIDFIALNACPPERDYEALSYCWGDAKPVASICIANKNSSIPIAYNLQQALLRIRSATAVRTLWVDSICINQQNEEEKSAQVRLMHEIYRLATNVLIWIDEPQGRQLFWWPARAFRTSERLYQMSLTHPDLSFPRKPTLANIHKLRKAGWKHRPPNWACIGSIFSRPWFRRMWVIQEVSCSRNATILCGEESVPFDRFMKGVRFGIDSGLIPKYWTYANELFRSPMEQQQPIGQSIAMEMYNIKGRNSNATETFLDYLQRFATAQCQDPRDKIFALYGISGLPHEPKLARAFDLVALQPDYRIDIAELYIEVAKACMRDGSLDVLSKPCPQRVSQKYVLPTWAIDWAAFEPGEQITSLAATGRYKASQESTANPSFLEARKCTLKGIFVDEIAVVGNCQDQARSKKMIPRQYGEVYDQVYDWASTVLDWFGLEKLRNSTYLTGEQYTDVAVASFLAMRTLYDHRWYRPGQENSNRIDDEKLLATAREFTSSAPPYYHALTLQPLKFLLSGLKLGNMSKHSPYDYRIVRERNVMVSIKGYAGMCPFNTLDGDYIVILEGAKVPFILRKTEDGSEYMLLGEAYIHGIMQGEAYDEEKCTPITIV